MNTDERPFSKSILIEGELTEKILGAAFKVLNHLGTGFLGKVYENALSIELKRSGLLVEPQKAFHVKDEGGIMGEYQPGLVWAGNVIVQCKCTTNMYSLHDVQ